MRNIFTAVSASPLFAGISEDDLTATLNCLDARKKLFSKDEIVYCEGDAASDIGILLDGRLHLTKTDIWGRTTIITEVAPPDMFAEAAVASGLGAVPVTVVAKEPSEILFINYKRIIAVCPSACSHHSKLISNMLSVLARKNLLLTAKMEHITKRTTRDKLLSYLSGIARQSGGKTFNIPYSRQELADYLCVDRSALSAQMSKLKSDKVINFRKNHFALLKDVEV